MQEDYYKHKEYTLTYHISQSGKYVNSEHINKIYTDGGFFFHLHHAVFHFTKISNPAVFYTVIYLQGNETMTVKNGKIPLLDIALAIIYVISKLKCLR